MRQTLILQPVHNTSTDILRCFASGKPLSASQRNFLDWHQKQLSSQAFDPVYKYYIERYKNKSSASFMLPSETLTTESLKALKKRLSLYLKQPASHVLLKLTQNQLMEFNKLNANELIFWHGNQYLTGAPFFPGGIPPVLYFQWGNYFGVVKYVVLAEEKSLKSNTLIYFEDMQDRELNQCVLDYNEKLKIELQLQQNILEEHKIDPTPHNEFLIKTPRLTLDPYKHFCNEK